MKNVHIISHSHWDREWYMPFEYHRAHLIKLLDDCMELFEKDEDYRHFHLDGHTILVEDYLEIKPENREKIEEYIKARRFSVGPWYVLQDEFLTSSEANIRNLLVGMKLAEELGGCCKIGYFPDAFGNAGQMPQILHQAGMKAIIFGRGVKSIGVDNSLLMSEGQFDSSFSELHWESPDGSRLLSILFANWYNNGMEIPTQQVRTYWDEHLAAVEKYAATDELLLMNGCDHQPVQKDLTQALWEAQQEYPEYRFIHSDFETYVEKVRKALKKDASVVRGELTSQETDGWCTLANTASANVEIKIMNRKGEQLLEGVAEPLAVIAARCGKRYPREMLLYAWKTLMKNHPHDSICGCSCDEVNEEIKMRFIKSRQAAETVVQESLEYIAQHIDTSKFEGSEAAFSVLNTYGKERSAVVTVDVDVRRMYGTEHLHQSSLELEKTAYRGAYKLQDDTGKEISCTVSEPEICFGYELPNDTFRKPYMAERVRVTFEAEQVPPFGYRCYGLYRTEDTLQKISLITAENTMENDYLRVQICQNGTLTLIDKCTGYTYSGLLRYEDVADIGNEYTFVPAPNDMPIYSGQETTEIILLEDEPYRAEYKIKTVMMLPKSADEMLAKEQKTFTDLKSRKAGRSKEYIPVSVETYVSLEKQGKGVRVKTVIDNTARDHRMRVCIPTGFACAVHKAESVFEVVERKNDLGPNWTYPSGCNRQQGFVMIQEEKAGLAVANIGLYEYEILKDRTIAVTLFRAVGELGDWGVFPTEVSQCLKKLTFTYEIVPFQHEREVYDELVGFQYDMQCVQNVGFGKALYHNGIVQWTGENLRMTALKGAMDSEDMILRWVNYGKEEEELVIQKTEWIQNLYRSNVIEERGDSLQEKDGGWRIIVRPYEILTLGCVV